MYNNDYIIAVDENGQPYIAHALGDSLRKKWGELTGRATTYVQKIKRPDGTFRYIYDTAKKAGKKAWGSKAGRWIDSHDAGITERLMARRASRKARQSAKRGDRAAEKYYAHRSKELNQEFARENKAAKENIAAKKKAAYDKTVGRAKDWLGYDEREARDKAYQALLNGSYNERTEAGKRHRLKETQDAYAKTLLGRYDQWNSRRKVRRATKK